MLALHTSGRVLALLAALLIVGLIAAFPCAVGATAINSDAATASIEPAPSTPAAEKELPAPEFNVTVNPEFPPLAGAGAALARFAIPTLAGMVTGALIGEDNIRKAVHDTIEFVSEAYESGAERRGSGPVCVDSWCGRD